MLKALKNHYWRLHQLLTSHEKLARLSRSPSRASDSLPIKTPSRIYLELTYTLWTHGQADETYYAQNIHHLGRSVRRNYISYPNFRRMRDHANKHKSSSLDYTIVLRDKVLFDRYFRPTGIRIPNLVWQGEEVPLSQAVESLSKANLTTNEENQSGRRFFFKPALGIKGENVFHVELEPDATDALAAERTSPPPFLKGRWLAQEALRQHPVLAALNASSVNTLRIVTYLNRDSEPVVYLAYLRIGRAGRVVDNAASGGIIVSLDQKTGILRKPAYLMNGASATLISKHPDTGTELTSHELPFFFEALAQTLEAHRALPQVHSIGWDVALTETGPVLLEGNDDWGGNSVMWLSKDFQNDLRIIFDASEPA